MFTKLVLVISSLNSKRKSLAAAEIASSRKMNRRRTLILSNAEDLPNPVLSPKRIIPAPGEKITGLILLEYRRSLCFLPGLYASFTALRIVPLEVPAGENHGNC